MSLHICEGCGAVERGEWPDGWTGVGASAYRVMATAEWCPECIACGAKKNARMNATEAALDIARQLRNRDVVQPKGQP